MFNFGNNQWWINHLAQRTKTKNLLPKLHRGKIDEENDGGKKPCSVDKTGRLKQSSKLHGVSNINKRKPPKVLAESTKAENSWEFTQSLTENNLSPFRPLSPIRSFKSLSPPPSIDFQKIDVIRNSSKTLLNSDLDRKWATKDNYQQHQISMRQ